MSKIYVGHTQLNKTHSSPVVSAGLLNHEWLRCQTVPPRKALFWRCSSRDLLNEWQPLFVFFQRVLSIYLCIALNLVVPYPSGSAKKNYIENSLYWALWRGHRFVTACTNVFMVVVISASFLHPVSVRCILRFVALFNRISNSYLLHCEGNDSSRLCL